MNALRYLPFLKRGLVRSGPPVHLTLFVTGACNLRCRHCFHWREVAEGVPGPSVDRVERLAASLERMGPLLWVSFGGGEPFLRRDLPALARAFTARGLRHLAIPTNGLVERQVEAVERIAAEAPDTFVSIAVSFDGPPDVHDAIRARPGAHARAVEGARALVELRRRAPNLGVGLIATVTRENQEVLAGALEELVDELEPDHLTINLARSDALDRSLLDVDPARYAEVVATKRRLVRDGRLPGFDFPLARLARARDELLYERIERLARGRVEPHLDCTAGRLSLVVLEDGRVRACEVLADELGSLEDVGWDVGRLWDTPRAEALRERIRATRCRCTWECAQADNVLFDPASWPRLAWRAARS